MDNLAFKLRNIEELIQLNESFSQDILDFRDKHGYKKSKTKKVTKTIKKEDNKLTKE